MNQHDRLGLPPFADLVELANSLSKNGRYGALKKTLTQAWRAESCLGDLRQAQYCCEALRRKRPENKAPEDSDGHAIEKSLLTTALLLYARATHTAGKGTDRGSISLQRGQLTDEQWHDHQELIGVRNQALAHVNAEYKTADRTWHKQLLFAVRLPSGQWKPACASNETSFHRETFERLQRMLPVAHALVLVQFDKRMRAVTDQINDARVPEEMIRSKVFDPVAAFGSVAAVERLLSGSGGQTDSFWYNE